MSPGPAIRRWAEGTFSALAVRNYRLFFFGQGISLTGSWMRRTALGWYVFELTRSEFAVGMVMALALAPMLASPLTGALADRMDKRRLIIASQLLMSFASAVIAVLILTGVVEVWHLMALALLGGVGFALEVPARQAFVVEMVGRDRLLNAIALNSGLVNLSRIVGPSIAGLVMWQVGVGMCFLVDAVSYLFVIGTLLALRLPPPKALAPQTSRLDGLLEGAREVTRNKPVRLALSLLCLTGVFAWSVNTILPAIAQGEFALSEFWYGVVMSMFGVGAIGAMFFVARRKSEVGAERTMAVGVCLMIIGTLGISFSPDAVWLSFWLVVTGAGGLTFATTGNTIVQLNVDDAIRGRVMGLWALSFGGSLPFGSLMIGKLAALTTPFWAVRISGCILLVASAIILMRARSAGMFADRAPRGTGDCGAGGPQHASPPCNEKLPRRTVGPGAIK